MVESFRKISTPKQIREVDKFPKEIDLLDLVNKAIILLKQNKTVLIITSLFGIIGGLGFFYFTSPVYQSELVISVPDLQKHEMQKLLTSFDEKVKHNTIPGLQRGGFRKIELMDVPQEQSHSFVIGVATAYKDRLPVIQEKLLEHFNQNGFLSRQTARKRTKIEQTIDMLIAEELKVTTALDRTLSSKNLHDADFSVADLAKLKIDMHKERIALESELDNLQPFTIVQDFVDPSRPYNKSFLKIFAIAMIISVSAGVALIIIMEILRLARARQSKTVPFVY